MLTFPSSILNFLASHVTALSFKTSFLKRSPLKTPVGHNPFSMFQILISLHGDQQASPTKRKIQVPFSRAMGCFQQAKLKRKECITYTNCPARAFTRVLLLLCHTKGRRLCCQIGVFGQQPLGHTVAIAQIGGHHQ